MKKEFDYYDITPQVSESLAVFPGDTPFSLNVSLTIEDGGGFRLSDMKTTVHVGAHVDAPNHYESQGQDIASRSLDYYLGLCQVITVKKNTPNYLITVNDVKDIKLLAPRVIFHTGSFPSPTKWCDDFTALCPELIDYLASQGVFLIGIDTPSIDLATSKVLNAHHKIALHDMAILEGVVLSDVPDGIFQLCALPLKIKGADASPVRAILIKKD
jgi:arylformamidase